MSELRTYDELLDELTAMTRARDRLADTADRLISERDTARADAALWKQEATRHARAATKAALELERIRRLTSPGKQ